MEHKDQKVRKYEDGSEQVIGALIEVHRALGPGLLCPLPLPGLPDLFVGPLLPGAADECPPTAAVPMTLSCAFQPSIPWNQV